MLTADVAEPPLGRRKRRPQPKPVTLGSSTSVLTWRTLAMPTISSTVSLQVWGRLVWTARTADQTSVILGFGDTRKLTPKAARRSRMRAMAAAFVPGLGLTRASALPLPPRPRPRPPDFSRPSPALGLPCLPLFFANAFFDCEAPEVPAGLAQPSRSVAAFFSRRGTDVAFALGQANETSPEATTAIAAAAAAAATAGVAAAAVADVAAVDAAGASRHANDALALPAGLLPRVLLPLGGSNKACRTFATAFVAAVRFGRRPLDVAAGPVSGGVIAALREQLQVCARSAVWMNKRNEKKSQRTRAEEGRKQSAPPNRIAAFFMRILREPVGVTKQQNRRNKSQGARRSSTVGQHLPGVCCALGWCSPTREVSAVHPYPDAAWLLRTDESEAWGKLS